MSEHRKRILVDFDGVLHSYSSGWQGARVIPDPPVPGAIEWLCRVLANFDIAIYSSRSHHWGGRMAMKRWLREHAAQTFFTGHDLEIVWRLWSDIECVPPRHVSITEHCWIAARHLVKRIEWPRVKVPAHLQIDDRAMMFTGAFPTVESIRRFRPWTKARHS